MRHRGKQDKCGNGAKFTRHGPFSPRLAFDADGSRLASGSGDKIIIWDTGTGQELAVLHGHTGIVVGAAFGPNGRRPASAGTDGTIKICDTFLGQEVLTLGCAANRVAFDPGGHWLVAAGGKVVKIWDASPLDRQGNREAAAANRGR